MMKISKIERGVEAEQEAEAEVGVETEATRIETDGGTIEAIDMTAARIVVKTEGLTNGEKGTAVGTEEETGIGSVSVSGNMIGGDTKTRTETTIDTETEREVVGSFSEHFQSSKGFSIYLLMLE